MPSALQLSARLAYRALGPRLQAELVIRFGFVTRRVVRQAPPTREAKAGLYLRRGRAPGAAPKAGEMARYERTGDAEADAGLGPAPWATPGWSCHAARRAGSLLYLSLNFIEA